MRAPLPDAALDQLFRTARTLHGFRPDPVGDETLHALYELMKWGPTSANCCPLRVVFARSPAAKEKLKPALIPGNVAQTMSAPVTAVVGRDLDFFEHLPRLYPATDAKSWFAGNPPLIEHTALVNGSLQAAYLILAARSLGLDCGPMAGFDAAKVDEAFFAGTRVKSFVLINLGHGDPAKIYPRGPRFEFNEACRIE